MNDDTPKPLKTLDNTPKHYPRERFMSPLMVRIMAVNIFALVVLVGGILYLNDFQERLINARITELETQTQIIAGALGEAAIRPESTEISLTAARQILLRLVAPTDLRARLFAPDGRVLTDSLFLASNKTVLEEELLPPSGRPFSLSAIFEKAVLTLIDKASKPIKAPEDIERLNIRAKDFLEAEIALSGQAQSQIRRRQNGAIVINIATPVQRFRHVLGALMITAETEDINAIIRAEKLLIVKLFLGVLAVTVLTSFFFARTLATPIRILARAAERVRRGMGREYKLPEFSDRNDEIGDLSRSLSDMTRALYNQIDAVERFAADVAHELKNPLTSMNSAVETFALTKDENIRAKLMNILKDDIKRLERLINDVSDASRLDAELTRGGTSHVSLTSLLESLVEGYKTVGLPRDCHLELLTPRGEAATVEGMEPRLGQVWRNLIDNALSFSPDGGTVTLAMHATTRQIRIEILDEGPGLPPGSENKIFKRFYSERPDHEDFGNHSGLGLAISQQIIEAHGGRLIASNRMDNDKILGAKFEITLPRPRRS